MNDGPKYFPKYLGGTYYPRFMAGNRGVEPLQTRSQSPARYHYANPLYLNTYTARPVANVKTFTTRAPYTFIQHNL